MHPGVFIGEKAERQKVKILILGESHHWSKEDWALQPGETEAQAKERREKKAKSYKTKDVMNCYFDNYLEHNNRDKAYRFFDNIVQAFDVDPENRMDFWNRVWFGNYIDELCGVRNSQATNLLKKQKKRKELNDQLFKFIEENQIDIIFCFSRRVYNKLPSLDKDLGDREATKDEKDSHRLSKCVYCSGVAQRKYVTVSLSKAVTVYGLKHPSQGFSYRKYQVQLANIMEEISF